MDFTAQPGASFQKAISISSDDETYQSDNSDDTVLGDNFHISLRISAENTNDGHHANLSQFQPIDNFVFNGAYLRRGKTVELRDGDFLKIKEIKTCRTSERTVIIGHKFRRNREIDNMLPKKRNDVTWLLSTKTAQNPPGSGDSNLYSVPVEEIVKFRQLFLTNDDSRSYSDGIDLKGRSPAEKEELGPLMCRWKLLLVSKDEGSLERLNQADCTPNYGISEEQILYAFRGATVKGGSCPSWTESEKIFDNEERRRCNFADPLSFYTRPHTLDYNSQRYTLGDAFCGVGGTSRGAKGAGVRVAWGFDFDKKASEA